MDTEMENVYSVIGRGDNKSIIIRRFHSQVPWQVEWGLLEACGMASNGWGYVEYRCCSGLEPAIKVLDAAGWKQVHTNDLPEPPVPDAVLAHEAKEVGKREAKEKVIQICMGLAILVVDGDTQYEQGWVRGIGCCIEKIEEDI